MKNSLNTVQALAAQTARTSASIEEFQEAFEGRLAALSRGHDLLTSANWGNTMLRDLIAACLQPYETEGEVRFHVACDGALVVPHAALALHLILHELATNSAKHGALSVSGGQVDITCEMGADGTYEVAWRERGGPRIAGPPKRRGFGTILIERSAAHDLDGGAVLEYAPDGLSCRIEIAGQHLLTDGASETGSQGVAG